jgi:hypothetical protein
MLLPTSTSLTGDDTNCTSGYCSLPSTQNRPVLNTVAAVVSTPVAIVQSIVQAQPVRKVVSFPVKVVQQRVEVRRTYGILPRLRQFGFARCRR